MKKKKLEITKKFNKFVDGANLSDDEVNKIFEIALKNYNLMEYRPKFFSEYDDAQFVQLGVDEVSNMLWQILVGRTLNNPVSQEINNGKIGIGDLKKTLVQLKKLKDLLTEADYYNTNEKVNQLKKEKSQLLSSRKDRASDEFTWKEILRHMSDNQKITGEFFNTPKCNETVGIWIALLNEQLESQLVDWVGSETIEMRDKNGRIHEVSDISDKLDEFTLEEKLQLNEFISMYLESREGRLKNSYEAHHNYIKKHADSIKELEFQEKNGEGKLHKTSWGDFYKEKGLLMDPNMSKEEKSLLMIHNIDIMLKNSIGEKEKALRNGSVEKVSSRRDQHSVDKKDETHDFFTNIGLGVEKAQKERAGKSKVKVSTASVMDERSYTQPEVINRLSISPKNSLHYKNEKKSSKKNQNKRKKKQRRNM